MANNVKIDIVQQNPNDVPPFSEPETVNEIFVDGLGMVAAHGGIIKLSFFSERQSIETKKNERVIVCRLAIPPAAAHIIAETLSTVLKNLLDIKAIPPFQEVKVQ